jgi:AbrB family looped-hinge helix DNA binding protein
MLYFHNEKYNQGGEPMEAKISSKGWVVIPAKLRQKYNLKPGDRVQVVDYGGVVSLVPASADPVTHAAGMLRGRGSLTKALLEEHRRERRRGR